MNHSQKLSVGREPGLKVVYGLHDVRNTLLMLCETHTVLPERMRGDTRETASELDIV